MIKEDEGLSVRRRTEAFTWSREIYRQWANGGACWLDREPKGGNDDQNHDDDHDGDDKDNKKSKDDAESFTALQHVYSSFTATAVNQNGKPGAPGSSKEEYSDNISVLSEGHLQQNRNYGGNKNSGKSSDQCLHDSEIAVNKNRSRTGAAKIANPAPQLPPGSYSTCCKTAEISPDPDPSAVNKDRVRPIKARDYKKLEIPDPNGPSSKSSTRTRIETNLSRSICRPHIMRRKYRYLSSGLFLKRAGSSIPLCGSWQPGTRVMSGMNE